MHTGMEDPAKEDRHQNQLSAALTAVLQRSTTDDPPMTASFPSAAAAPTCTSKVAVVRAPGRVNLIGEHIDYHGYSVLPMALEHCVTIAVGKSGMRCCGGGGTIMVRNLNQGRYPGTHVLPLLAADDHAGAPAEPNSMDWVDYVRCALRGVCAYAQSLGPFPLEQALDGLGLVVHGTVPPAAGLSSSSALVVASALAFLWALGISVAPTDLATLCIDCERLIGTAGGGMDQSASILAQAGQALWIEFSPTLAAMPVPLPEDAVFVVANSLVVAEKAKAAHSHYNLRVVEGRLAVALLGKALGVEGWRSLRTLWALEEALRSASPPRGPLTPDLVRRLLHPGAYTIAELQEALGTPHIVDTLLADRREAANLVLAHNAHFKLRDRVLHVLEEARRVRRFRQICEEGEGPGAAGGSVDVLARLGALMDASHESCRLLYECSHPQLDALVAVCCAAGALGVRMTGAGWGGCCVSLVGRAEVDGFVRRVWEGFYVQTKGLGAHDEAQRSRCLFVTRPGPGASVVESSVG